MESTGSTPGTPGVDPIANTLDASDGGLRPDCRSAIRGPNGLVPLAFPREMLRGRPPVGTGVVLHGFPQLFDAGHPAGGTTNEQFVNRGNVGGPDGTLAPWRVAPILPRSDARIPPYATCDRPRFLRGQCGFLPSLRSHKPTELAKSPSVAPRQCHQLAKARPVRFSSFGGDRTLWLERFQFMRGRIRSERRSWLHRTWSLCPARSASRSTTLGRSGTPGFAASA